MKGGIFTTRFVDPYLKWHKIIYEKSDGRVGKHSNGVPALLLTTTGRKSGLPRTNGLTYCRRSRRYHRGGFERRERPGHRPGC